MRRCVNALIFNSWEGDGEGSKGGSGGCGAGCKFWGYRMGWEFGGMRLTKGRGGCYRAWGASPWALKQSILGVTCGLERGFDCTFC